MRMLALDARKTTAVCAIASKFVGYGLIVLSALVTLSCSKETMEPNTDAKTFSQQLTLTGPMENVRFEIVTLPESKGAGGDLGPTDYVALVARATLSTTDVERLSAQPRVSRSGTIPRSFVRDWLNAEEKYTLEGFFYQGRGIAHDIANLVSRPTKRAIALPLGNDQWLFYLEYVAPN